MSVTIRTTTGKKINSIHAWGYYDAIWGKMPEKEKKLAEDWLADFRDVTRNGIRMKDSEMQPVFNLFKKYVDKNATYSQGCSTCYAETYRFIDNLVTIGKAE